MSDTTETKQGWDAFLTDEAVEGESYIEPNIETKLSKEKRQECREIVQEIKTFGIGQRQLLYLIQLLTLELEDQTTVKALSKAIGFHRENIPIDIIDKTQGSSLILPGSE